MKPIHATGRSYYFVRRTRPRFEIEVYYFSAGERCVLGIFKSMSAAREAVEKNKDLLSEKEKIDLRPGVDNSFPITKAEREALKKMFMLQVMREIGAKGGRVRSAAQIKTAKKNLKKRWKGK